MSVIQVTNVDYLNLIEDIRSEADRLIAQSVSTLLMRYFVSNEYVMLSVLPDSKPFFRELVKIISEYSITPGDEHRVHFRLMVDEAGRPCFQLLIDKDQFANFAPITKFFRFTNVGDIFQTHYKKCYESLKEVLVDEIQMGMLVSPDFTTCSNASCPEFNVHFGVYVD